MVKLFAKMNPFHRAVARFLIMGRWRWGGAHCKCQMHKPCRGVCILHSENGKQLQVTTIKTTKSNKNKSILRLDLSGSTVPGGATALLPPSPASYGSVSSGFPVYPHSLEISLHSIVMHFKRRHLQSTNYHR